MANWKKQKTLVVTTICSFGKELNGKKYIKFETYLSTFRKVGKKEDSLVCI